MKAVSACELQPLHIFVIILIITNQANVLVSASGQPMICDFGISRVMNTTSSLSGNSPGSLRWMAREFIDGSMNILQPTMKTDVWAFGMTVYVCIHVLMLSISILMYSLGAAYRADALCPHP